MRWQNPARWSKPENSEPGFLRSTRFCPPNATCWNLSTQIGASAVVTAFDIGPRVAHDRRIAPPWPPAEPCRTPMLSFPNDSRSFDRTRRAVRFWGYDSSMEASFFVTESALEGLQPNMRLDEDGM